MHEIQSTAVDVQLGQGAVPQVGSGIVASAGVSGEPALLPLPFPSRRPRNIVPATGSTDVSGSSLLIGSFHN